MRNRVNYLNMLGQMQTAASQLSHQIEQLKRGLSENGISFDQRGEEIFIGLPLSNFVRAVNIEKDTACNEDLLRPHVTSWLRDSDALIKLFSDLGAVSLKAEFMAWYSTQLDFMVANRMWLNADIIVHSSCGNDLLIEMSVRGNDELSKRVAVQAFWMPKELCDQYRSYRAPGAFEYRNLFGNNEGTTTLLQVADIAASPMAVAQAALRRVLKPDPELVEWIDVDYLARSPAVRGALELIEYHRARADQDSFVGTLLELGAYAKDELLLAVSVEDFEELP